MQFSNSKDGYKSAALVAAEATEETTDVEDVDLLVTSLVAYHLSKPKEDISPWRIRIMESITIANCIQIAVQCQWNEDDYPNLGKYYNILDILFACVFTMDVASIWYVTRGTYFNNRWNIFDFSLTIALVADLAASCIMSSININSIQALRLARCVRIVRILRVLKAQPELTILVEGMLICAKTIGWLLITLVIIITFFSVVFVTQVDHDIFADDDLDPSATLCEKDKYFCDLVSAMASLLSVTVGGSWDKITYPMIEHQPALMIPFLAFFVLTSYGVVNVMVAVVVDCVTETKIHLSLESKATKLRSLADMWKQRVDTEDSREDRKRAIEALIEDILQKKWISFPAGVQPETVMSYLKRHQRQDLTYEDFIVSLSRLLFSDRESFAVQTLTQQAKITSHVSTMHDDLDLLKVRMEQLNHKLDTLLGANKVKL